MPASDEKSYLARRASGRCVATILFSFFGGAWLLLSSVFFERFHVPEMVAVAAVVSLLAGLALKLRRTIKPLSAEGVENAEESRAGRAFGLLNAVTYGAVFLVFLILPRVGLNDFVFPVVVGIVGLHFFPMPRLYQHRATLVLGGLMTVWSLVCILLWHGQPTQMNALATLGAGLLLWGSAVLALGQANSLSARAR